MWLLFLCHMTDNVVSIDKNNEYLSHVWNILNRTIKGRILQSSSLMLMRDKITLGRAEFSMFSVSPSVCRLARPEWLQISSLCGWSGYWLDLGPQCTNTEIRREMQPGSYSCSAHSTPLPSSSFRHIHTHKKNCSSRLHWHPDMVPEHW